MGHAQLGKRYLSRYISGLKSKGFGRDVETSIAVLELGCIAKVEPDRELLEFARTLAASVIPPGQENLPEGAGYSFICAGLGLAATLLGDRELAGRLRRYHAEHDEFWTPGVHPTRRRLLGLLDLTLGNHDAAVGELEQTLADYAAQQPGPNPAWILSELAEALLARGRQGDVARATELLHEGLAMATTLGMVPLQDRYRSLAARIPAPSRRQPRRGPAAPR